MPNDNTAVVETSTAAPAGETTTQQATQAAGQDDAGKGTASTETTATNQGTDEGKHQEGKVEGQDQADRDEKGQFRSKIQKRFDELTHARHAAEREAARWRAIAEGRQAEAAPQAHEFANDADYETALRRHEAREAARETAAEQAKQAAQHYEQDAAGATDALYNARVQDTISRIPDFAEVVGKADIQITNDMMQALKGSAHGPDIVYQLAKNPAEAQRIASLPTAQMYMTLGAMEAAVSGNSKAAAPAPAPVARTTGAPPPAKTSDLGAAPPNTDPSKMSFEEFKAWRRANGSKYV